MSYLAQARLASDSDLLARVTACAATENIPAPDEWAYRHRWVLSAQPGWAAAYASALESAVESPGAEASVISDGMILAAVQSITAAQAE